MFGLSFSELVIIAILALILLGPDKLPDAAKSIAKGLKELRKATDDLKDQLGGELSAIDDAKRAVTNALTGAIDDATAQKKTSTQASREPPPAAVAANVPGLEAARVDPRGAPEPPAAPSSPPKDAIP